MTYTINEGDESPWGEIDYIDQPVDHIPLYWVSTPGHGGYMVHYTWAMANLSGAALDNTFEPMFGDWYCFEEDCDWALLHWEVSELRTRSDDEILATLHHWHKPYLEAKGWI